MLTLSLVFVGMTVWILRGSKNIQSSTAIIGFVMCSVVLLGLRYVRKRAASAKRVILVGTLALTLLGPLAYFLFQAFDTTPVQVVLQATGRNMTLTDRTYMWTDILNNPAKSPILGVGIGAFWVGPIGYNMYPMANWDRVTPQCRPTASHNGFAQP